MVTHDMHDWTLGAAVVFGCVIFVAAHPPVPVRSRLAADSLRSVRRIFVVVGLLLTAGTAVVLANTSVEAAVPRRDAADSLRYLTQLVDTAGAPWHLQALGLIAGERGDTGTSHWAIRRLLHLDCSSSAQLRHDLRYRELMGRDSVTRRLVGQGCGNAASGDGSTRHGSPLSH